MVETTYEIPGCPIHFALLSDIHNRPYQPVIESLRNHHYKVHSLDAIFITGDILYGTTPTNDISPLVSQTNAMPLLTECVSLAPTYFSLGNHEWMLDAEDLKDIRNVGVTVLDNEFVCVDKQIANTTNNEYVGVNNQGTNTSDNDGLPLNENKQESNPGQKIIIGGLTSAHVTDYRRTKAANQFSVRYPGRDDFDVYPNFKNHIPETGWMEDFYNFRNFIANNNTPNDNLTDKGENISNVILADKGENIPNAILADKGENISNAILADKNTNVYRILLSHHPEYFPVVNEGIDLMLSGHAHGGQWRIFDHGVFSPGQGIWPRWTKGLYENNRLLVSCGLSNTAPVPRLFNPREIIFAGK